MLFGDSTWCQISRGGRGVGSREAPRATVKQIFPETETVMLELESGWVSNPASDTAVFKLVAAALARREEEQEAALERLSARTAAVEHEMTELRRIRQELEALLAPGF